MTTDEKGRQVSVDGVQYWNGKRWVLSKDGRDRVNRSNALTMQASAEPYHDTALYERALLLHTHNVTALRALIGIYSRSNRSYDVADLCRRFLQIGWDDEVVRELAWAYTELGQWEDAIAASSRVLDRPEAELPRLSAAYTACISYRALNDAPSALQALRRVDVTNLPTSEFLRIYILQRAMVKYLVGEKQSAIADLDWIDATWPVAA